MFLPYKVPLAATQLGAHEEDALRHGVWPRLLEFVLIATVQLQAERGVRWEVAPGREAFPHRVQSVESADVLGYVADGARILVLPQDAR